LPASLQGQSSELAALSAYTQGTARTPAPVYFIDSNPALLQAVPKGKQLGRDLHFLGGYGVKEVCGLQVAFLSGRYDPELYETPDVDFVGGAFTARAVGELERIVAEETPRTLGIDILLTCGWPAGIEQQIKREELMPCDPDNHQPSWRAACAVPFRELCAALEPRYHIFASADIYYARPPFQTPRRGHVCRCVGLGRVPSSIKLRKWLHALSLAPMEFMKREDLMQSPPNVTPCPFPITPGQRRPASNPEDEPPTKRAKASDQQIAVRTSASEALVTGDLASLLSLSAQLQSAVVALGAPPKKVASKLGLASATKADNMESDQQKNKKQESPAESATAQTTDNAQATVAGQVESSVKVASGATEGRDGGTLTEEAAKREAAEQWLRRDPKKGTVRYTFNEEGPLGLRFSRDVPPWILEVRDGSLSAKKAPRVPVAGIVVAVNGHELVDKDCQQVLQALKSRPVTLDVEWPVDQGKPTVNRA